jgi:hypothetical protein
MNLPVEEKLEFLSRILETFTDKFEVLNMREHAQQVAAAQLKCLDYEKRAA